ncbi:hypothetical protein C2G38_2227268 [Gigaspora rosea]|uniref:Uncharacterized protein n=1 Tax=Gigaspora rosea TaxID=44941 RepID=A0A397U5F3_9GLOM|nr:hypothetical protein C2G38_2227268 [Gigaspora rosea]
MNILLRYRDRLEFRNIREALQNTKAWNYNNNKFGLDKNSSNNYIFDQNLDMDTIAELADTVNRSLDDTTICPTILKNQIKRATRSIQHKYTNLQQDLVNE